MKRGPRKNTGGSGKMKSSVEDEGKSKKEYLIRYKRKTFVVKVETCPGRGHDRN